MIKTYVKYFIKKGLIVSKKNLSKNKTARRAGTRIRNVLFAPNPTQIYNYSRYAPTIAEYQKQLSVWENYNSKPLISIVVPTYNTPVQYLRECIESVLIQSYPNWELCISDDASPNQDVLKTIKEFMSGDKRIKLVERKTNGHISEATNSAIEVAQGQYIALLDHDDVLWPNALFEIAKAINENPDVDLIYTDEDKIDEDNDIHSYPFFKPDWSPEFLESCNYITHFSCIRKTVIDEIGGLRRGYEGAQDWDLLVRITEKTSNIIHIPKILYSWRIHENSTAMDTDTKPYVYEAQRRLLLDHIDRIGEKAVVNQGIIKQHSNIEYSVNGSPKISVIIGGGKSQTFKKSIKSVVMKQFYPPTEILLVPYSKKELSYCRVIAKTNSNCIIIDPQGRGAAGSFNQAAKQATGSYLVFLDASLVVTTPNWLELLVGDAQRSGVGVVGGKVVNRMKDRFMRAACATGIYGLYAPLLEGMPVEDIHYIRGLYGQSRRNVSVLNGYFMVNRRAFEDVHGFSENLDDMFDADFCLKLLELGYRHIYNPMVQASDLTNKTAGEANDSRNKEAEKRFQKRWERSIDYDPYFNPSFSRTNAQLEIK